MSIKQLKNKIIKQAGPLSKPEDENKPGFDEVDKAKEQYQKSKSKAETEKSEQKEDKSKKEDKSESANTDNNIKTFIDNLKSQGWKLNHNKSSKKTSLEKTIQKGKNTFKYVIINDAFNVYTQNVIYSSKTKYSKILANIILEQKNDKLTLNVEIHQIHTQKKQDRYSSSSNLLVSTVLQDIPLDIKSEQLIKKIQETVKATATKKSKTSETAKPETAKTATKTQNEPDKNSQAPIQKTEDKKLSKRDMKMIASIIDTLQQEEVEALQHKYPILNMYN